MSEGEARAAARARDEAWLAGPATAALLEMVDFTVLGFKACATAAMRVVRSVWWNPWWHGWTAPPHPQVNNMTAPGWSDLCGASEEADVGVEYRVLGAG